MKRLVLTILFLLVLAAAQVPESVPRPASVPSRAVVPSATAASGSYTSNWTPQSDYLKYLDRRQVPAPPAVAEPAVPVAPAPAPAAPNPDSNLNPIPAPAAPNPDPNVVPAPAPAPVANPVPAPANPAAPLPATTDPTEAVSVTVLWIETTIGKTSKTWFPRTVTIHINLTPEKAPLPGSGQIGMGTLTGVPGRTKTIFLEESKATMGAGVWKGGMGLAVAAAAGFVGIV